MSRDLLEVVSMRDDRLATRPAAAMFDLDNTLYEYERPHATGMDAVRRKVAASLTISPAAFDKAFGTARTKVKERLGHTAASHSRLLYFNATVEALGYGPQILLVLDMEQTYWRAFLAAARLAEGAENLLIELRAQGVKLALVTDLTSQIQYRKLIHFGIDRYFDAVVTSEEAGVEKVGLTPFHMAAEKLGLVAGAPVWMVGDSTSDIEGSRTALGALAIQKLWGLNGQRGHPQADIVITGFETLLARVMEWDSADLRR